VSRGGSAHFRSSLELGYQKLAFIEKAMKSTPESDVCFELQIDVDYWEDKGSTETNDLRKHGSESAHIRNLSVARSHWTKWLAHWGKDVRTITISGLLAKQLDELIPEWGALDYDDLIGTMTKRFREAPFKIENQFLCTLPTKRTLQRKLVDILADTTGIEEVLITGWIDGVLLPELRRLLEGGIRVRIITRFSQEKGVRDAIHRLSESNAAIRENKMVHARMIIVGDKHVIVSSADLKTDSLSENREAGIYTTDPTIIGAARSLFEEIWNESISSRTEPT